MDSKKIGQITWITFPNFGTFLQAYALQKSMLELGFHSMIVDDSRFTYLYFPFKQRLRKYLGFLRHPKMNYYWLRERHKLLQPFNRFKNKYLKIDRGWKNVSDLDHRYKGFICGSDQIWSPLLPDQHDGFYFASFSKKSKIAYAPSIGCYSIPAEDKETFRNWLKDFKAICTREESASFAISDLIGKEIPTVLDPTLLLDSGDWDKVEEKNHIHKPYLLCYFLTYNKTYIDYAERKAKDAGLRLVSIGESCEVRVGSEYRNIGPGEFVGLIKNARMVITDSYHGTIFSILYNRPFLALKRFRDTDERNQNSRIESLFTRLGINTFLSEEDLNSSKTEFVSDFEEINEKLDKLRESSLAVLKRYLELI